MGKILGLTKQPDLSRDPTAFQAYKLPIPVKFRIADVEQKVKSNEGEVTARAGDAIMTSDSGKVWQIDGDKFWATYTDNGDGTASKKKIIVNAVALVFPIDVAVSWANEPIHGSPGDYLIQGGPEDFWIVEKQEFFDTYEMLTGQLI